MLAASGFFLTQDHLVGAVIGDGEVAIVHIGEHRLGGGCSDKLQLGALIGTFILARHKMAAYALGRPLTFGDRAEVDRITAALRRRGDGLADLVFLIVKSDLFQLN